MTPCERFRLPVGDATCRAPSASIQFMSADKPVIIVGAGMGGLASAISLASEGIPVVVVERSNHSGGKIRQEIIEGRPIDAGTDRPDDALGVRRALRASGSALRLACTAQTLEPSSKALLAQRLTARSVLRCRPQRRGDCRVRWLEGGGGLPPIRGSGPSACTRPSRTSFPPIGTPNTGLDADRTGQTRAGCHFGGWKGIGRCGTPWATTSRILDFDSSSDDMRRTRVRRRFCLPLRSMSSPMWNGKGCGSRREG